MFRWARIWPVLLIGLVAAVPLWRCWFHGETVGPVRQVFEATGSPSFSASGPERPWDVLQADAVLQFLPWRKLVLESWSRGELPAWNPYVFNGAPLLANSQSGAVYPPHILFGLLRIPYQSAIPILAWLHLWLAGCGVYQLVRFLSIKVRGSEADPNQVCYGALVGGIGFVLTPFMLAWASLPSVISTVAWIPWLWLGIFRVAPKARESARGWTWQAISMAFVTAMLITAGHLQFAFYGLATSTLLAVIIAAQSKSIAAILRAGSAIVAGLCLAAPHLMPVLDYSGYSHRKTVATGEGYESYIGSAIQWPELATIVNPTLQGSSWQSLSESDQQLSSYWPAYRRNSANFAETACSVGCLLLLLAIISLREAPTRSKTLPVAVLGLLALALAIGTPLNALLYYGLPGWASTGSPGRAIVIFVLALVTLAGVAADRIGDEPFEPKNLMVPVVGLLLLFLFGVFGTNAALYGSETIAVIRPLVSKVFQAEMIKSLVAVFISLVAVYVAMCKPKLAGPTLIAAVVGVALLWGAGNVVPTGKITSINPDGRSDERVADISSGWEMFVPTKGTVPPNLGILLGRYSVDGYDSLVSREIVSDLQELNGRNPSPPVNGNMMMIWPTIDREKLPAYGVSKLYQSGSQQEALSSGRFSPGATFVSGGQRSLTLKASAVGEVSCFDRAMPGWSVKVDGQPAKLKPGKWLAVDVTEPDATVQFTYTPPGFIAGCWLAALSVIALTIGFLLGSRRLKTTELSTEC